MKICRILPLILLGRAPPFDPAGSLGAGKTFDVRKVKKWMKSVGLPPGSWKKAGSGDWETTYKGVRIFFSVKHVKGAKDEIDSSVLGNVIMQMMKVDGFDSETDPAGFAKELRKRKSGARQVIGL